MVNTKEVKKEPNKDNGNGLGISSLVLGIISIGVSWIPFLGLIPGIVGLVMAIKQRKIFPNNIATGGLVTSIIGIVFSVITLIMMIISIIFMVGILSMAAAST